MSERAWHEGLEDLGAKILARYPVAGGSSDVSHANETEDAPLVNNSFDTDVALDDDAAGKLLTALEAPTAPPPELIALFRRG